MRPDDVTLICLRLLIGFAFAACAGSPRAAIARDHSAGPARDTSRDAGIDAASDGLKSVQERPDDPTRQGSGTDLTVDDAGNAVNEGSLRQHLGNSIVNYDVPTRLVQTRCGKDALETVAFWERIAQRQGVEPRCNIVRPGWIACISLGHGAGVTTALALVFRQRDGRLMGGLVDTETGLKRPLDEMLGKVAELYKQMEAPSTCP